MVPTSTRGTSGESPRVFNSKSLICRIISNDFLDAVLNTNTYPCTPNEAFLDKREYSSYMVK
jgi:hypothetical protein